MMLPMPDGTMFTMSAVDDCGCPWPPPPTGYASVKYGSQWMGDPFPAAVRYEAEDALINNAVTAVRGNAWNGIDVGMIDYSNSYVQFDSVHVPTSGKYILSVGFSNGFSNTATHAVTVNGAAAGSVRPDYRQLVHIWHGVDPSRAGSWIQQPFGSPTTQTTPNWTTSISIVSNLRPSR